MALPVGALKRKVLVAIKKKQLLGRIESYTASIATKIGNSDFGRCLATGLSVLTVIIFVFIFSFNVFFNVREIRSLLQTFNVLRIQLTVYIFFFSQKADVWCQNATYADF